MRVALQIDPQPSSEKEVCPSGFQFNCGASVAEYENKLNIAFSFRKVNECRQIYTISTAVFFKIVFDVARRYAKISMNNISI